jgi:hypothetical protein
MAGKIHLELSKSCHPRSATIVQAEYRKLLEALWIYRTDGILNIYLDVPPRVYRDLARSKDADRYFDEHIRDKYSRLSDKHYGKNEYGELVVISGR